MGIGKKTTVLSGAIILQHGRRWEGETKDFWRNNSMSTARGWLSWEFRINLWVSTFIIPSQRPFHLKVWKGITITLIGYYHWASRRWNSSGIIYVHNGREKLLIVLTLTFLILKKEWFWASKVIFAWQGKQSTNES